MKVSRFLSDLMVVVIGLGMVIGPEHVMAQRPVGIDVSDHQNATIDWATLKSTYGITFGWAKATVGVGSGQSTFAGFESGAKAAGILIGAYHYARYDLNMGTNGAVAEANYFWSVAKNYLTGGGVYLVPMLDIEATNTAYNKTTLSQWVNQWCTTLSNTAYAAGYTIKPCIYASTSFADNWFDSTIAKWNPDLASWNGQSLQTGIPTSTILPWTNWVFWQYNDMNAGQAITSGDGDVFNGTMDLLRSSYVIGNFPPTNVTVNVGSNATFRVGAGGAATLHYQWSFNQTAIAGATSTSYIISNAQPANAGPYTVAITNTSGPVFTATASLGVISQLTNGPGAILAPANLVDWWPAEGNANDIFGASNSAPFYNVSYGTGKQGMAFYFDGLTSYMSNNAASLPVPWTASMWVNRQNAPSTGAALTGDGNYELKLEQYNGTRKVGYTQFGVGDFTFNYIVPTGTWTHLAFVGASTGTSLYVNGALQATMTNTFPLPRAYIGAGWVSSSYKFVDYMLGSLDEIMMFNRALTATEIHGIYTAGSAGLVRAPEFTGIFPSGVGKMQLTLKGQTGKNFTIRSSTNLVTWTSVGSISNPAGTNGFTDTLATKAQNYYRASQP